MKPTILITTVMPTFLVPYRPISTNTIQRAYTIRYYLRGGKDVLCVRRDSALAFTIYVPQFCSVSGGAAQELIKEQSDTITKQMVQNKIPMNSFFLFDSFTKMIVCNKDFISTQPFYNIKDTIFCVEDEDGSIENDVRYIADTSDYGVLCFLSLILAKSDMLPSTKTQWSGFGKKLLFYLVSSKYNLNYSFRYFSGPWDTLSVENSEKRPPPSLNLSKLKKDRAIEIAIAIYNKTKNKDEDTTSDEEEILVGEVLQEITKSKIPLPLSSLLRVGIDTILGSQNWMGDTKTMEVDIDILNFRYKRIMLDFESKLCMVELNNNPNLSTTTLREDFQSDKVVIVEADTRLDVFKEKK